MVRSQVLSVYGAPDDEAPTKQSIEWRRIDKAIEKSVLNRNQLAHLHVWHSPEMGTFGHGHIFKLSQLPTNPIKRKKHVITVKKLRDYRRGFCIKAKRLRRFYESI
jgi:hypothetical protein